MPELNTYMLYSDLLQIFLSNVPFVLLMLVHVQLWMGTLNDLRMKIYSLMYLKSLEQMYSRLTSHAQLILLLLLESSFRFWPLLWKILRNTSRLRSKFLMIRMFVGDSGRQIFRCVRAVDNFIFYRSKLRAFLSAIFDLVSSAPPYYYLLLSNFSFTHPFAVEHHQLSVNSISLEHRS